MSSQESLRIIDKRQNISGTEYLFNSGDWIASSTSRCINPELVELYEYLHNSGFRKGVNVFNPLLRPRLVLPKGVRKRTQSSSDLAAVPSPTSAEAPLTETKILPDGSQNIHATSTPAHRGSNQDADQIASNSIGQEEGGNSQDSDSSVPTEPPSKKPRIATLRKEGSLGLSQLSIESIHDDEDNQGSGPASPSTSAPSSPRSTDQKSPAEDSSSRPTLTSKPKPDKNDMAIVEFNKNTENMITIYFKSGLDATGVEMIDMVLGPKRRPSKDFIAAFFFAVILSPLTEAATIEAGIHVLDRVLTLHGPEPFQAIWDVQKRRREFAEGFNPFSKALTSSDQDPDIRTSSRSSKKPLTLKDLSSAALAGRLPSWNDTWDLIKAEFGLDTRDEAKQHITLQEHQIRLRLQGSEAAVDVEQPSKDYEDEDLEDHKGDSKSDKAIKEEQEIREEVGRAIVGLLLRVMEQDAVLNNMSPMSFFCRDVLRINRYSPGHSIRQTLDLAFQIVGLATSSRYFEAHPQLNHITSSAAAAVVKPGRVTSPWPVNERCTLSSAGLEILQLGQQIILLLVRFAEAGELLPGKGLEELAREVISRLSKVNKDRKLPSSSSGGRGASFVSPLLLERYNLDQTEVFLKTLIQGPCLLEAGTGSGASVKLRRDAAMMHQQGNVNGAATDSVVIEQEESSGMFKSQIGVCTGSSVFVMVLVDYWFRNNTTANNPGNVLNFRVVVEKYTAPGQLRPSTLATASTTAPVKTGGARKKSIRGASSKHVSSDDELRLTSTECDDDQPSYAQWNAKDLEEIEWTVMMTEILIWAWIEARGIRRDEIQNTGLEQVLFPEEVGKPSLKAHPESGWLLMSEVLGRVGGTLKTRWEQLESVIEAALLVEDLGLR